MDGFGADAGAHHPGGHGGRSHPAGDHGAKRRESRKRPSAQCSQADRCDDRIHGLHRSAGTAKAVLAADDLGLHRKKPLGGSERTDIMPQILGLQIGAVSDLAGAGAPRCGGFN